MPSAVTSREDAFAENQGRRTGCLSESVLHTAASQNLLAHKKDLRSGPLHEEGKMNWVTVFFMGLFHAGAIAAVFFFSWTNLIVTAVLYFLAINVGVGMAYHRLL